MTYSGPYVRRLLKRGCEFTGFYKVGVNLKVYSDLETKIRGVNSVSGKKLPDFEIICPAGGGGGGGKGVQKHPRTPFPHSTPAGKIISKSCRGGGRGASAPRHPTSTPPPQPATPAYGLVPLLVSAISWSIVMHSRESDRGSLTVNTDWNCWLWMSLF